MLDNRTQTGAFVLLGTAAIIGWIGFLILYLRKEEKPIQIPAPVVHVTSPATTVSSLPVSREDESDLLYSTPTLDPNNGGSGQQPDAVISFGNGGHFLYKPAKGAIEFAVRQDVDKASESFGSVRVLLDSPPSQAEILACLKSQKSSVHVRWIVGQIRTNGIEWRIRLPFTNAADPKTRQIIDAERERRIKKIVAAAESGGNG